MELQTQLESTGERDDPAIKKPERDVYVEENCVFEVSRELRWTRADAITRVMRLVRIKDAFRLRGSQGMIRRIDVDMKRWEGFLQRQS